MPNYKEMYFDMVRETEKAINILIQVQRKCEELYINDDDRANIIHLQEKEKE